MPKVTFVSADGRETTLTAQNGQSVMQVAMVNGVEGIVAECGGSAMCATCHVYVDTPFVHLAAPASEIENEMLDCVASQRRPGSRLSCQIQMSDALDGLRVFLPETQQ